MSVEQRGIGEILDEACTLAIKISHDISRDKCKDRFLEIMDYVEKTDKLTTQTKAVIMLLFANSTCWLAQDLIKGEHGHYFAMWAQELNKVRNSAIGELNEGKGIVTDKTY